MVPLAENGSHVLYLGRLINATRKIHDLVRDLASRK
jgi:hypothetical protein